MTTLADDLLLVLLDPASGKPRADGTKLDYGLAGALLLDLALAEHVDVVGTKPSITPVRLGLAKKSSAAKHAPIVAISTTTTVSTKRNPLLCR